MAQLLAAPYNQFFDNDGNPLAGGKIYTYAAGTTTPRATYTDAGGLTPASNPVLLDSEGRASIWMSGYYKIVVKDSNNVQLWEVDSVTAQPGNGDMQTSVYDPALIQQQLVGLTATQTLSNKTLASPILSTPDLGTPSAGNLVNCTGYVVTPGNLTGAVTSVGLTTSLGSFSSANLRTALTDESGTGAAYFQGGDAGTPSALVLTNATGDQTGTNTNSNAAAGKVGEFISSPVLAGAAVSLTSTTAANVTSISLTAGDWDVWGCIAAVPGSGTTTTYFAGGINTVSATQPAASSGFSTDVRFYAGAANTNQTMNLANCRVSIAGTTTVYLVATSIFAISTQGAYGFIGARRAR